MAKLLIVLYQLCITPQQQERIDKMNVLNKINECKRLVYKCSDRSGPFTQDMIDSLMYICDGGL